MRSASGKSAQARIALATCAELPDLDDDTRRVIDPLRRAGVRAEPAVWNDPRVDWTTFDLTIVRCCWDYAQRREEFLEWAARIPALLNAADVLAWNTDKRYLRGLARAGIPTVPTIWLDSHERWDVPGDGLWVIKPAVSLASLDTGRYLMADAVERALACAHLDRLRAQGRTVMMQPYMRGVDEDGETSLVYFNGIFQYAVRKAAALLGPDAGIDRRFLPQGGLHLQVCQPTLPQRRLAEQTLDAVPGGAERLLYARVDLVPGSDGAPLLLELELTEPQLYFTLHADAAHSFAAAILRSMSGAYAPIGTVRGS
jgi:hypothetical protein